MAYNGSGTFTIQTPGNPVVTGTAIASTVQNATMTEIAGGLSTALCRDGQSTPTGNIKLGGFKLINVGPGTAATDGVIVSQLQTGSNKFITAAGTNTITGTMNPTLTAYATGDTFTFVVAAANTSTVTLNIDSVGAKDIRKNGTQVLIAGDLIIGSIATVTYDGTQFQLLDPNVQTQLVWADAGGTADALAGTYTPAVSAVVDGMILGLRAASANATTTPTFSPSGLTARTITKNGGSALVAGDIAGDNAELLLRYFAGSTRWELLNPKGFASPMTTRGDIITQGASLPQRLAVGGANTALVSDGTDPAWGAVVRPAVSSTLSVGYPVTTFSAGTQSSGTFTPSIASGEIQSVVNGGAHTLAPPSADGTLTLQYTNNGSAGAITTSGFTKVNGAFTTTNGDDFFANIIKSGSFSLLTIVALQ